MFLLLVQLELIRTSALVFPSAVKKSPENIKKGYFKEISKLQHFLYTCTLKFILCVNFTSVMCRSSFEI